MNKGKLVNQHDGDIKLDYDPTQKTGMSDSCSMTYKQIFYETMKFIHDNNVNRPYLQYPKLYLQCKIVICDEKKHCKECYNYNTNNVKNDGAISVRSILPLCLTKRREIGDKLYDSGRKQKCISDSLTTTAAKLFICSESLIEDSNEYGLNLNWFAKLYSFLKWNHETVRMLLHDLVYLKQENDNSDVEQSIFLFKFDFLTTLHSYLDKLIEYLVLYYCCFDVQSWIAIFYPFIEAGIGTYHCQMLFAKPYGHSKQVSSLLNETDSIQQEIDRKENILKELKALNIFKRLLCDTLRDIYNSGNNDNKNKDYTIVNYVLSIKNSLDQMVDNITSKHIILNSQISNKKELDKLKLNEMKLDEIESKNQSNGNVSKLDVCNLIHKNISTTFKHLIATTDSYSFPLDRKNVTPTIGINTLNKKWKFRSGCKNRLSRQSDSDVYYHYFTEDELKQALKPVLMRKLNFIAEFIDVICGYCDFTSWSQLAHEKSLQTSIHNSNDGMISYAICDAEITNTILLSTVIDKTAKSIYRFLFKTAFINIDGDSDVSYIRVGIMTPSKSIHMDLEDAHSFIGVDKESMCWSYYWEIAGECAFIYDNQLTQQIAMNMTDVQSRRAYFLIEIDLTNYKFRVFSPAFASTKENVDMKQNDDNLDLECACMECDIPEKFVNEGHLRIGVTIRNEQSTLDIEQSKHVGVGLVRQLI